MLHWPCLGLLAELLYFFRFQVLRSFLVARRLSVSGARVPRTGGRDQRQMGRAVANLIAPPAHWLSPLRCGCFTHRRLARFLCRFCGGSFPRLCVRVLFVSDLWHYFFPFFQDMRFELVFFFAALVHFALVGRHAGYPRLLVVLFFRPQGLPVLQSIQPLPPF